MMADARYLETLWNRYVRSPDDIPADWRNAFSFIQAVYGDPFVDGAGESTNLPASQAHSPEQILADYLRRFGHLHASLDPLGLAPVAPLPAHLTAGADAQKGLPLGYQGTLAVETGHLDSVEMAEWVISAFEEIARTEAQPDLDVYQQLIETEVFERFLGAKYSGKKRFGSEGADAILPLLHAIRKAASEEGVDEIILGSMHRGRHSILANFMNVPLPVLLSRIKGDHPFPDRRDIAGDVPYHLGHRSLRNDMQCVMLANPSHLEAVNPVIAGYARARRTNGSGKAMAIIVHTDTSVIGQGVNAELLQMSGLTGFAIGGVIHIVINNQIGFTTEPDEARTSRYCTGAWRAVDSLLAHVNGDDVDAVVNAGKLAVRYRERFARDAVIDLVCYRANGHNEIDEPRFTQPVYYKVADAKQSLVERYEQRAIAAGRLTAIEAGARRAAIKDRLEAALLVDMTLPSDNLPVVQRSDAGLSEILLRNIVGALSTVPDGDGNAKMIKLMARRMDELDRGITWALAETAGFAAALVGGVSVRLCGQDIERGPFSQRHLAAIHPDTGNRRYALDAFATDGATLEIVNSPLSEYAVLGFEYGYSLAAEKTLCVWEAQFGDFANGAQIMIDQFITSGFEKWQQMSNLTVLLPHGLEGQGPEHSSARIERLLQLCARDNMMVAHPSTPANYFHLLRNQALNGHRPLFIVTPKVLLRLPQAKSPLADFIGDSTFRPVLVSGEGEGARDAILCSGKIAYELEKERSASGAKAVIIRLESLYPFPAEALSAALADAKVERIRWLQEEPENFGAGAWLMPKLVKIATESGLSVAPMVARRESSSPAGSFHGDHDADQHDLLRRALGLDSDNG